jgi:hypothetical protein
MRRLLIVVCCLASLAVVPGAAAQEPRRDPFRPLVSEDAGSTAVPPGTEGQPSTSTGTPEQGPATSEGTPNTGVPASDWSAVATMLIVLGAGAVGLARLRRPVTMVPRSPQRG